jgi:hypothetical protein
MTVSRSLLACAIVIAARATAQVPANRLWASVGGGYGHSGAANSLGKDEFNGLTGDAAAGVMMTGRGVLAVEATGFRTDTPTGVSQSAFFSLTLLGYLFGSAVDHLYFQGGFGVGVASFPTVQTTAMPSRVRVTRPSLQVALGYDVPIACPVWATAFFQSYGTFGPRAGAQQNGNAVLFHGGIALRFAHPGPARDCRNRG